MEQIAQKHELNKPGRNSLCVCGSGKKHKKCCLNKKIDFYTNDIDIQRRFEKEVVVVDPEKFGMLKMSTIILEYADELIREADTKERKEKAIILAITAWNISFSEKDKHKEKIDKFLHSIFIAKNSHYWNETSSILQRLINKKLENYNLVDRFIVDYTVIQSSSNDYRLKVVSTIYHD